VLQWNKVSEREARNKLAVRVFNNPAVVHSTVRFFCEGTLQREVGRSFFQVTFTATLIITLHVLLVKGRRKLQNGELRNLHCSKI